MGIFDKEFQSRRDKIKEYNQRKRKINKEGKEKNNYKPRKAIVVGKGHI